MNDHYSGREQTKAKHHILKHYLEELAFKVLNFNDLTYVDGFSGPWKTKDEKFADSSFMIAISVLLDAQRQFQNKRGVKRRIRCFFSEKIPSAYSQLTDAVAPYHKPSEGFEIYTYCGQFENAVDDINRCIGGSFPLIFIDPTGWTGYPIEKITPIFAHRKCEVLINFMFDHVNRFASSSDAEIEASLNPILGGEGWRGRLDPSLPTGAAVEKLFRDTLRAAGGFKFVVSTEIQKATADRPHFFITYGTKDRSGLIAYRQIEYNARKEHSKDRGQAKERVRELRAQTVDLFTGYQARDHEATFELEVQRQQKLAENRTMQILKTTNEMAFTELVDILLESFVLRVTNVKSICADLASAGRIENTWGGGNRRPQDDTKIRIRSS